MLSNHATMLLSRVLLSLLFPPVVVAMQLPPEIQADRYLMQAKMAIAEQDFRRAKTAMDTVLELQAQHDLELPEHFSFQYAEVLDQLGLHAEAIKYVTEYLTVAGRDGKYYRAALKLLNKAEAEMAAAAREKAAAEARPAWESICDGSDESPSCWKELESHRGCYVWNPNVPEARSVTWTGDCVAWRAEGVGTLHWEGVPGTTFGYASSGGLLRGGKHTGQWTIRYKTTGGSTVAKGSLQAGERHGPWVFRHSDGSRSEGGYVNGLRHGRENHYDSSGRLFAWTDYVHGVNQFGKEK